MTPKAVACIFVAFFIGILACISGCATAIADKACVPNVTGQWKTLDTEADTATLTLLQEGHQVQGKILQWGEEHTISAGRLDDNIITITVIEGSFTLTLKATVQGDKMVGGTSVDSNGHRTAWSAQKQ